MHFSTARIYSFAVMCFQVILLQFLSFEVEAHANCSFDYVAVYLGASTSSPQYGGKYCNTTIPPAVLSQDQNILIKFHSDYRVDGNGFKLAWDFIGESPEFFSRTLF